MKVRTRLTLLFTLITGAILLLLVTVIYYSAKNDREQEFYTLLKKEAITKANLFFNAQVDVQTLQEIYRNNRQILSEVEVAIYNKDFDLMYHDAVDIDVVKETKNMVDLIYQKGEIRFYQDDWQIVGLKYQFRDEQYIITAAAYDQYGYTKLSYMLQTSIIVFLGAILLMYGAGFLFSKKVLSPITEMTDQVRQISTTNLHMRLHPKGTKDELSELAATFNDMLVRLQHSFESQKQFVSNVAHEIRTPLAAIIAELDLSTTRSRTIDEYKATIDDALGDARRLTRLSSSLLDFARATYDPIEIALHPIRIDELLLEASLQVQKVNPTFKITIHFEREFEEESEISVYGNSYLLRVAFINLFENGCKFSTNQESKALVSVSDRVIQLDFLDSGIGIADEDLKHIFEPFYRGANKGFAEGNGIGLSLTQRIVLLHKGDVKVQSKASGTTFSVVLPSLK